MSIPRLRRWALLDVDPLTGHVTLCSWHVLRLIARHRALIEETRTGRRPCVTWWRTAQAETFCA
jgi:hypothetical protein